MPAIFFALISYFGWGIGDIFGTIATRKIGAYSTTFWSAILGLCIFSIFLPFKLNDLLGLTPFLFSFNLILGAIFLIGFVAFNEGLRVGNASLVGTITASFSALVVVLSITFLKESINQNQILAILIIFFGLILSTFDFKNIGKRNLKLDKGVLLATVAMISWGIYFTFIKIPVREIGWFFPNFISFSLFPPLIFLYTKFRKIKIVSANHKSAFIFLIMVAVLLRTGDYSFNFAIDTGLTSVVAPIAGSYPTLFVVLAFLVFKDKITKQQVRNSNNACGNRSPLNFQRLASQNYSKV